MIQEECVCEHCGETIVLNGFRYCCAKTIECIFCHKRTITGYGKLCKKETEEN